MTALCSNIQEAEKSPKLTSSSLSVMFSQPEDGWGSLLGSCTSVAIRRMKEPQVACSSLFREVSDRMTLCQTAPSFFWIAAFMVSHTMQKIICVQDFKLKLTSSLSNLSSSKWIIYIPTPMSIQKVLQKLGSSIACTVHWLADQNTIQEDDH